MSVLHSYEIHKCIINEGSSGKKETASRTQIMEEEKFLFLVFTADFLLGTLEYGSHGETWLEVGSE